MPWSGPPASASMRELGATHSSYEHMAMFETNVSDGKILWMNPYALWTLGLSESQIAQMSLMALAPANLSGIVTASVAYGIDLEKIRNLIWPMRTADGLVAWWYVT